MILWINACVRGEQSRTQRIAQHLADGLGGEVVRVDLDTEPILPLNSERLEQRSAFQQSGDFSDEMFRYARQWAQADEVIISAPYWDLSFPSLLKIYIENICVVGLTFAYNEQGVPFGLGRAKRLYYVTTAGGEIINDDLGFGYIKSAAEMFFSIPEVQYIKAECLDVIGVDAEERTAAAIRLADDILRKRGQ